MSLSSFLGCLPMLLPLIDAIHKEQKYNYKDYSSEGEAEAEAEIALYSCQHLYHLGA
jgi:hypothetical protein